MRLLGAFARAPPDKQETDVAAHNGVLPHVGLLSNGPPDRAGCPSSSHPTIARGKANTLRVYFFLRYALSAYFCWLSSNFLMNLFWLRDFSTRLNGLKCLK